MLCSQFSQQPHIFRPVLAGEAGSADPLPRLERVRVPVLGNQPRQVLSRIARQASQVGKQDATLTLGQAEIAEAPDRRRGKGAQLRFVVGNAAEGDIGRPRQKLPDLLDRLES